MKTGLDLATSLKEHRESASKKNSREKFSHSSSLLSPDNNENKRTLQSDSCVFMFNTSTSEFSLKLIQNSDFLMHLQSSVNPLSTTTLYILCKALLHNYLSTFKPCFLKSPNPKFQTSSLIMSFLSILDANPHLLPFVLYSEMEDISFDLKDLQGYRIYELVKDLDCNNFKRKPKIKFLPYFLRCIIYSRNNCSVFTNILNPTGLLLSNKTSGECYDFSILIADSIIDSIVEIFESEIQNNHGLFQDLDSIVIVNNLAQMCNFVFFKIQKENCLHRMDILRKIDGIHTKILRNVDAKHHKLLQESRLLETIVQFKESVLKENQCFEKEFKGNISYFRRKYMKSFFEGKLQVQELEFDKLPNYEKQLAQNISLKKINQLLQDIESKNSASSEKIGFSYDDTLTLALQTQKMAIPNIQQIYKSEVEIFDKFHRLPFFKMFPEKRYSNVGVLWASMQAFKEFTLRTKHSLSLNNAFSQKGFQVTKRQPYLSFLIDFDLKNDDIDPSKPPQKLLITSCLQEIADLQKALKDQYSLPENDEKPTSKFFVTSDGSDTEEESKESLASIVQDSASKLKVQSNDPNDPYHNFHLNISKFLHLNLLTDDEIDNLLKLFFLKMESHTIDNCCKQLCHHSSYFRFFALLMSNPYNCYRILDALIFFLTSSEFKLSKNIDQAAQKFPYSDIFNDEDVEKPSDLYRTCSSNMLRFFTFLVKFGHLGIDELFIPLKHLHANGLKSLKKLRSSPSYDNQIEKNSIVLINVFLKLFEQEIIIEAKPLFTSLLDLIKEFSQSIDQIANNDLKVEKFSKDYIKEHYDLYKIESILSSLSKFEDHEDDDIRDNYVQLEKYCFQITSLTTEILSRFYLCKISPKIDGLLPVFEKYLVYFKTSCDASWLDKLDSFPDSLLRDLDLLLMNLSNSFSSALREKKESGITNPSSGFSYAKTKILSVLEEFLYEYKVYHSFFLMAYEIADLVAQKTISEGKDKISKDSFYYLVNIGIGFFSLINLRDEMVKERDSSTKEDENSKAKNEIQSLGIDRIVSSDPTDMISEIPVMKKSYSQLRKGGVEAEVDYREVFAKFVNICSKFFGMRVIKENDNLTEIGHVLKLFPVIFNFEQKENAFRALVQNLAGKSPPSYRVNRNNIVEDTLNILLKSSQEHLRGEPIIVFIGEPGVDGGGLSREWFTLVTKGLISPEAGLFKIAANRHTLVPNLHTNMGPGLSDKYRLLGIMIAKALMYPISLDINLSRSFLKHMLGMDIAIKDLEDIDSELAKSMHWILENSVEGLDLTFTYEVEIADKRELRELVTRGADILVDDTNKKEFVKRICLNKMITEIQEQVDAFLKGFDSVIPLHIISPFTVAELQLLISGEQVINIEDMKNNIVLSGFSKTDKVIEWVFEILTEFNQNQRAAFLYFISGSTRVPFGGFSKYPVKFSKLYGDVEKLPQAHTCFYEMDIPMYLTKEKTRDKLMMAVFDGSEGYGFG